MKPKKSRFLHGSSSRTKSNEGVSKMTKSLAHIGVLVLLVGVLLTTCVGSAWTMEVLTDEEMALVRGTDCLMRICDGPLCGSFDFGECFLRMKFFPANNDESCQTSETGLPYCDTEWTGPCGHYTHHDEEDCSDPPSGWTPYSGYNDCWTWLE